MPSILQARQLGRVDPTSHATLLHPTDINLNAGDRVSLSGASGSGKSVMLRALALLDAPSGGDVLWQGERIAAAGIPAFRSQVVYIAQRPALLDGSVEDNLRLPYALKGLKSRHYDAGRVRALLAMAGKSNDFLNKRAAQLSGGEAQITALVRALQLAPQVLLLDEPTAALDAVSAGQVECLVNAWMGQDACQQRAFVWVSHDAAQALRMGNRHLQMSAGVLQKEVHP